jgi:hypothetical protein
MIDKTNKQFAFIQFYIEIDKIIGYLPAESENEIHDIYLKYLELNKQELEKAYAQGYTDHANLVHYLNK